MQATERTNSKYSRMGNQKGIALVMVLVMSAISLSMMTGLVYMVTNMTQISGDQKRYKTALEAGFGGADVILDMIGERGVPVISGLSNFSVPAENVGGTDCLTPKLLNTTTDWPTACNANLTIDPATTSTFDLTFTLGAAPMEYIIHSKIVDTVEGNTGGDEGLVTCGVVCSNPGEVKVVKVPFLYTVEVNAENTTNSAERAKLSILYQY